jgi:ATP adenylyltransferase/5',5'''-P-1,P-4-tetraphosphate phosphorylase II
MSWERVLLGSHPSSDLPQQIDRLLENQRALWRTFREGEEALAEMRSKIFSDGDARIIVQANPARRTSIHARVDPVSVSQRPCFLCPENLPPEERGIGLGELIILPNPHPILPRHLSIPTREHRPQELSGEVDTMLGLVRDMGSDMLVLYNGARCGASAPDHFHFQAASAIGVPLFDEVEGIGNKDDVVPHTSFGRRMLVFQSRHADKVQFLIQKTLEILSTFGSSEEEPLINIIALYRGDRYQAFVFPRAKHRPACYFAAGNDRISVSPGSLEMAGIMVVADADHFDRVDEKAARAILEEVSLDEKRFQTLLEKLA